MPGQFGLSAILNKLTLSRAHMSIGSWFQALGPATANARVPKCMTEELATSSPHVNNEWVNAVCLGQLCANRLN